MWQNILKKQLSIIFDQINAAEHKIFISKALQISLTISASTIWTKPKHLIILDK